MIKNFSTFTNKQYPGNIKEAENQCFIQGMDTLIYISKFGNMMGRGKLGFWLIGIPKDINTIYLAIRYELLNNRKVIFYSGDTNYDFTIYSYIKTDMDITPKMRSKHFIDSKFLCHSTSYNSFINILSDEEILSYSNLLNKNIPVNTLRLQLDEPKDYLDYVDLCDWNSLSSERVLASREKNSINMDDDTEYTPAVRIYFDTMKLYELGILISDGLHLKVKDHIPIKFASHFVISNKQIFDSLLNKEGLEIDERYSNKFIFINSNKAWTLRSFVDQANNCIKNTIEKAK